ncbi:hypothetical protein E2C01_067149 [Portunus trituberculatus]|uniref:Uncharacterized protein n=1 Tax=Portunus trituberculatus TaxID=210409 RepID=A0A5B7HSV4_PORTR|nr:hypothetical protein [Portunus trituberculatus]
MAVIAVKVGNNEGKLLHFTAPRQTAFHGYFWGQGNTFLGTSYFKSHPLGNRCPERESPTYIRTVNRIRTHAFGNPSDAKARMVPLYHY